MNYNHQSPYSNNQKSYVDYKKSNFSNLNSTTSLFQERLPANNGVFSFKKPNQHIDLFIRDQIDSKSLEGNYQIKNSNLAVNGTSLGARAFQVNNPYNSNELNYNNNNYKSLIAKNSNINTYLNQNINKTSFNLDFAAFDSDLNRKSNKIVNRFFNNNTNNKIGLDYKNSNKNSFNGYNSKEIKKQIDRINHINSEYNYNSNLKISRPFNSHNDPFDPSLAFNSNNNNNSPDDRTYIKNNLDIEQNRRNYLNNHTPERRFDDKLNLTLYNSQNKLNTHEEEFYFNKQRDKPKLQFLNSVEANFLDFHQTPKTYDTIDLIASNNEYYVPNASSVAEYAYKEFQNPTYRTYMEDFSKCMDIFCNVRERGLFTLYDGHGGKEIAEYVKDRFPEVFSKMLLLKTTGNSNYDIEYLLTESFRKIDQETMLCKNEFAGSTACVIYICKEKNYSNTGSDHRILYSANVGDTRSVIVTSYSAIRLSHDHKATDKSEIKRVIDSGGLIYGGRVCGQLNLTRAFGDHNLKKQGVIPLPFINKHIITKNDKYVIVASDGIWDVLSDDDCYRIGINITNALDYCKALIKNATSRGSRDNMSCLALKLN